MLLFVGLFSFLLLISQATAEERKPFNLNFQQNDYKLKFEWGEIISYNKHHVSRLELHIFKYNRTYTAANLTAMFKTHVGIDLELVVQAYKFTSNEYRWFPIRLQVNFCEAVSKNLVGSAQILKCGNFTACPIVKRRYYHICNWAPDPSHFPPFVPSELYKLELQELYKNEKILLANGYGEIYRPFVGK